MKPGSRLKTKVGVLATLWALIIALPELTLAAMLALGGYQVATGSLSLGTVIGAITVLTYLRWPLESLGWLLADAGNAAAATVRYWEVRDTAVTVVDPPRPQAPGQPVRGGLRIEAVHFRFPGATADVLQDGRTIASLHGGDLIGEMGLLERRPRNADVIASSPMRLLRLPARLLTSPRNFPDTWSPAPGWPTCATGSWSRHSRRDRTSPSCSSA